MFFDFFCIFFSDFSLTFIFCSLYSMNFADRFLYNMCVFLIYRRRSVGRMLVQKELGKM